MKYLIWIGMFMTGGIAGYIIAVNQTSKKDLEQQVKTELITEFIHDTIVQTERIEIPVYPAIEKANAMVVDPVLNQSLLDTISEVIQIKDSLEKELKINRDELLETKSITIQYLNRLEKKDSLVKNLLGIKESIATIMVVQFWESPLGFTGYKLSRNTLITYGVSPQLDYEVFSKDGINYLAINEIFYELEETQQFLDFKEIEKTDLIND